MTLRRASSVLVPALMAASLTSGAAAQGNGAKALFHGPSGSTPNPYGPVGIHYWFENGEGTRFTRARDGGAGARLRLHIRSNTDGFLTAWLTDGSQAERQLTIKQGQWNGFELQGRREYVVPGEIAVPATASDTRLLILFARSQTEQVGSAADAREKIRRLSQSIARDGAVNIVQEVDTLTPGHAGTYVVHRRGGQPGVEVEIWH